MNGQKVITSGEIYDAIVNATKPEERDHHESDLYCKVTKATSAIIDRYEFQSQVTRFHDATDPHRALWYDIPFAYKPYWESKGCK